MSFYDEMQGVATELLDEFNQGTLRYIHPGEPTGPAYDPQPGLPTAYDVDGVVRGVSQQYVDGSYVLATDQQATISVFGREPTAEGVLEVDGNDRQIVRVDRLPGAGTVVAYRLIIRS